MRKYVVGICVFLATILCEVFCANLEQNFCVTVDLKLMTTGAKWKNEDGCSCVCLSVNNYTFSQCDVCSSVKTVENVNETSACISNGFKYNLYEKWMSSVTECSMCQCQKFGTVYCSSEKHCSNSCQEGQIPQFGNCCEVNKCKGNATIIQETRDCLVGGEVLHHGKSNVKRYHCKDKFCTCNNGAVLCLEYCELSKNNSHYYWDKFCCPRKLGNKTCRTNSHGILMAGESFIRLGKFCRCFDGEIYCSKEVDDAENTVTLSSIAYTGKKDSYTDSFKMSTNTYSKLSNQNTKELIIILCLFFSVIAILFFIVYIIKKRIENINNYRTIKKRILQSQEDF